MDPITIGLAFTAAQSAVGHIKQAIALGKDVHGLVGQFSKFFDSADSIHRARVQEKVKGQRLGKTDAELGKEALQIAMHSDALRQAERELKDMIVWQLGKPQIWDDMIKERTRLFKERAEAERAEQERQIAHKKKIADTVMLALYFLGGSLILFSFIFLSVQIYGAVEEKKAYEKKVAERAAIIRRQQKEREAAQKKEALDAIK